MINIKPTKLVLNTIAGGAKSLHAYLIIISGLIIIISGIIRTDILVSNPISLIDIWNIIKTDFLIRIGLILIVSGYFFDKALLLNADMYGYISKSKMKKILKNCELVEVELTNQIITKKVYKWITPLTEYSFIINNDNSAQVSYGSFNNKLFEEDDPTYNIHKDIKPNKCKAYWNPKYPKLVVPVFLLNGRK